MKNIDNSVEVSVRQRGEYKRRWRFLSERRKFPSSIRRRIFSRKRWRSNDKLSRAVGFRRVNHLYQTLVYFPKLQSSLLSSRSTSTVEFTEILRRYGWTAIEKHDLARNVSRGFQRAIVRKTSAFRSFFPVSFLGRQNFHSRDENFSTSSDSWNTLSFGERMPLINLQRAKMFRIYSDCAFQSTILKLRLLLLHCRSEKFLNSEACAVSCVEKILAGRIKEFLII